MVKGARGGRITSLYASLSNETSRRESSGSTRGRDERSTDPTDRIFPSEYIMRSRRFFAPIKKLLSLDRKTCEVVLLYLSINSINSSVKKIQIGAKSDGSFVGDDTLAEYIPRTGRYAIVIDANTTRRASRLFGVGISNNRRWPVVIYGGIGSTTNRKMVNLLKGW